MQLYKLKKDRASFSFLHYFIKIVFEKTAPIHDVKVEEGDTLRIFIEKQNIAQLPKIRYSKKILGLDIEIFENIPNAVPLVHDEQKLHFFYKARNSIPKTMNVFPEVSWKALLPSTMMPLIYDKVEVFQYIDDALCDLKFPKTGMHGDLNPNNVLVDEQNMLWLVDWENQSDEGSFFWDVCWFYSVWKRTSTKAPDDIYSIYKNSKEPLAEIKVILLVYAVMKFRLDLYRHKKTVKMASDDFFQRITAIIEVC